MDLPFFNDSDYEVYMRSRHRRRQRSASIASTSTILPDVADDDNEFCEVVEEDANPDILFASEVIDLTKDDSERLVQHHRPDEAGLDSVTTPCGTTVKPQNFIQVRDQYLGELKINFIQVTAIIRDRHGSVYIRGIPYTKLRHLNGKIRDRVNEVCMVLHMLKEPNKKPDPPVLVDVEPDQVIRWRTLVVTNARYPAHAVGIDRYARSFRSLEQQRIVAEKSGHIVCRWSISIIYSINSRNRTRPDEELIEHLQSEDILNPDHRVSDSTISEAWRGRRKRGGAWNAHPESSTPLGTPILRRPDQAYTLFDSFSGAGGVSRGAQDASYKVRYAIDKEPEV
ncbi:hypothetical protein LMH87_002116 [Akanthomyces muscarius]|uniref:Uncharacterized protein n=1 Tax=Akanthomyces muscarius TaxID=2231603 RepID=A0A9W8Q733_AKAMU|nr:hypothetical protein LMH87_002116 [Akanthomyces muscarius]KAJ4147604.1 hypothetical protein LMH87_002116 [Akanthomyces muscarius]